MSPETFDDAHALPRAQGLRGAWLACLTRMLSEEMKLRDVMSVGLLKLGSAMPASDAFAQMTDLGIRHAVVVRGEDIVGVISDRDLGGTEGGLARRGRTVEQLMTADPIVGHPDTSVIAAALFMRDRHIGCVPVVDHGKLVGIVTRGDLLTALAQSHGELR